MVTGRRSSVVGGGGAKEGTGEGEEWWKVVGGQVGRWRERRRKAGSASEGDYFFTKLP